MNRRGGLGKGLAALIPPGEDAGEGRTWLAELPIGAIEPNPRQPRDVFDDEELEGLAQSIRDMGLLQPVVVRQLDDERFELIAGERRLRASKRAGLEQIPAVVRHTGDADLLKEALVENIHRVQLNPLEEAAAYQQLLEDFDFTQEELAGKLGKSRPAISNALRLLTLPPAVQRRVAAGVVSAGHAKVLLALADDPDRMERMASRVVAEGMSVRALEETIRLSLLEPAEDGKERSSARPGKMTAPGLVELQHDLSDALGARVRITMGARKGKLQVEFASVDDLERIVGVIARGLEEGDPVATLAPAPEANAPVDIDPPAPDLPPPPAAGTDQLPPPGADQLPPPGADQLPPPGADQLPPPGADQVPASGADQPAPPPGDTVLPPDDVLPTGPAADDLPAPTTWGPDAPDDAVIGHDDDAGRYDDPQRPGDEDHLEAGVELDDEDHQVHGDRHDGEPDDERPLDEPHGHDDA